MYDLLPAPKLKKSVPVISGKPAIGAKAVASDITVSEPQVRLFRGVLKRSLYQRVVVQFKAIEGEDSYRLADDIARSVPPDAWQTDEGNVYNYLCDVEPADGNEAVIEPSSGGEVLGETQKSARPFEAKDLTSVIVGVNDFMSWIYTAAGIYAIVSGTAINALMNWLGKLYDAESQLNMDIADLEAKLEAKRAELDQIQSSKQRLEDEKIRIESANDNGKSLGLPVELKSLTLDEWNTAVQALKDAWYQIGQSMDGDLLSESQVAQAQSLLQIGESLAIINLDGADYDSLDTLLNSMIESIDESKR